MTWRAALVLGLLGVLGIAEIASATLVNCGVTTENTFDSGNSGWAACGLCTTGSATGYTVTGVMQYIGSATTSDHGLAAIYTNNGSNLPGTLLCSGTSTARTLNPNAWIALNTPTGCGTLSPTTNYWVCFTEDGGSGTETEGVSTSSGSGAGNGNYAWPSLPPSDDSHWQDLTNYAYALYMILDDGTGTPTSTPTDTPTNTQTDTATPTNTPTATGATPTNTPPAQNGQACTTPNQCASMNCVDNVCCDTLCTEPNHTCNLPGREGTCLPITAAPTPTLSGLGKFVGLGVLLLIAGVGLHRRLRYPSGR